VSLVDPNGTQRDLDSIRQHVRLDKSLRGKKLSSLSSAYQRTEIPLVQFVNSNHIRSYGLEVDINGRRVKLVLDTGDGGIVIQRSAAQKAGVTRLTDTTLSGFGDNTKLRGGYIALADRVGVSGVQFRDALVNVSNQEFEDIQDGLIGTDVFSQFLVTIDFP